MITRAAAQGLTDGLSAVALAAYVVAAVRRGARSPLERRLVLVFGGLSLFFLFRSVDESFDRPGMAWFSELLAAILPVAGLWLAEGLLRRHSPWWLKTAITVAAGATWASLIMIGGHPPASTWVLGAFIVLSLLALFLLLLTRDRASLSHQENAVVVGFLVAAGSLLVLSLTDFLPSAPLGMSGFGAAALAFIAQARPASASAVRNTLFELFAMAAAGALFAFGLVHMLTLEPPVEALRVVAITIMLIVAVTTVLRALQERAVHDEAKAFRRALARSDTSSLSAFLEGLADQPLFKGLKVAEGDLLADYDAPALLEALTERPVWTRHAMQARQSDASNLGLEELIDLTMRTDASHAVLVSPHPLRIALLVLPEIGAAEDVETDLAIFCKLALVAVESCE